MFMLGQVLLKMTLTFDLWLRKPLSNAHCHLLDICGKVHEILHVSTEITVLTAGL